MPGHRNNRVIYGCGFDGTTGSLSVQVCSFGDHGVQGHGVQGVQRRSRSGVQAFRRRSGPSRRSRRLQILPCSNGTRWADFAIVADTCAQIVGDRDGIENAHRAAMVAVAQRYEELDAWKLCAALRDEVFRLTQSGPVTGDSKFREQIRDSSSSAPRNIAEGFGRFKPRQFAYFVRIARGSLAETRNHLQDGYGRGYFSDDDARRLLALHKRASKVTTRFLAYLDSCDGQAPSDWDNR